MKLPKVLLVVLSLGILPARADVQPWVPDPDSLGGMEMPVVTYTNTGAGSGSISVDLVISGGRSSLPMYPLRDWYLAVGGGAMGHPYATDSFDPRDPWYPALDPTQQNRPFSTQYGFDANPLSSPLPAGKVIAIRMVSATPGLVGYMDEVNGYDSGGSTSLFQPVFEHVGDTVVWSSLVMWHPVFTSSVFGLVSAQFEVFVADPLDAVSYDHIVDWDTAVSAAGGYAPDFITLTWDVIPEPTPVSLVWGALAWSALGRLRSRRR